MRKLLNMAVIALAGAFFASCEQEHIDAQYLPENVQPAVLGNIAGGVLAADGNAVTINYTKASYGVNTLVQYVLYVDKAGNGMASKQKVSATVGDDVITVSAKDMNTALLNAGANSDEAFNAEFVLVSAMLNDRNVAYENSLAESNVVAATFTPYNTEILPVDLYDHVWIIGNYCGWAHDTTQFLFDYKSTGTTYSGVIDFGTQAADGFKITGIAGWDDSCNWGTDGNAAAPEAEADEVTLISAGTSGNISCYSHRFYFFSFNTSTLVLTKQWSCDSIGIVGLNGDWNNDIVMSYNAKRTRFYADISADSDTEMKFRADADPNWALNWGADCVRGGDNIAVPAGNYRVYLDLGQSTIELSESMYGQAEPLE